MPRGSVLSRRGRGAAAGAQASRSARCGYRTTSGRTAGCPWRAGSRPAGRARGGSGRCRRPGARRGCRRKCSGCTGARRAACLRIRTVRRRRTARIRRRWCRSRRRRRDGGREVPGLRRSLGRCRGSGPRGPSRSGTRIRPASCRPCACGGRSGSTRPCTSVRTARRSRRDGSCAGQDAGWAGPQLRSR